MSAIMIAHRVMVSNWLPLRDQGGKSHQISARANIIIITGTQTDRAQSLAISHMVQQSPQSNTGNNTARTEIKLLQAKHGNPSEIKVESLITKSARELKVAITGE